MTDAKSAWNETGEKVTALGSKLGAHFEKQRGEEAQHARDETKEAIKRLGDAVQDAFEAVGAAAKDDAVRQDVKQVGHSLVGALDASFREISSELRKRFDKTPPSEASTPPPTPAPPATPGTPAPPAFGTPPPPVPPAPPTDDV